jgi:hypothetical protein
VLLDEIPANAESHLYVALESAARSGRIQAPLKEGMRFWFVLAALMGPRFFRWFVVFFAIGMAVMLYCLIRS